MAEAIRKATTDHAEAMAAIHAAAFAAAERWTANVIAMQLALPQAFGLVDERGGMLLAWAAADEAEILTLAVVPAARRRGIASALLREAAKRARLAGARAMFLEVAVSNTAAQALYAQASFCQVGRRRRYYADGGDALVLRLELDAPPG
jgi:ribosomal-protein-alanine N-acetyltransferase